MSLNYEVYEVSALTLSSADTTQATDDRLFVHISLVCGSERRQTTHKRPERWRRILLSFMRFGMESDTQFGHMC